MTEKNLQIVTCVCLVIIVVAFILCVLYIFVQKKNGKLIENRRWINQLPSLVSTLGVLGTFFGITIGLLNFDSYDLNASIPLLLSGLKTAFFTSLAGMTGSLILSKMVASSYDNFDKGLSDINVAAGQICQSVQQMGEELRSSLALLLTQVSANAENQSAFYCSAGNQMTEIRSKLSGVDNIAQILSIGIGG